MSAIRVICNMVNIVRLVSSLRDPRVDYVVVRARQTPEGKSISGMAYLVRGKRNFPESKHKPQ